ncbi:hypothetical protein B0H17DRAFT_1138735 [Mycena rosella]|uniref:Uncharacterized protein n=1 Tax=Mycena rosella TaxID=1033263 RepID=A0AAD7D5Q1_MYCRO|nr:hypothetical protein B0H17DRAFT_1138735 [Mycena rosella]
MPSPQVCVYMQLPPRHRRTFRTEGRADSDDQSLLIITASTRLFFKYKCSPLHTDPLPTITALQMTWTSRRSQPHRRLGTTSIMRPPQVVPDCTSPPSVKHTLNTDNTVPSTAITFPKHGKSSAGALRRYAGSGAQTLSNELACFGQHCPRRTEAPGASSITPHTSTLSSVPVSATPPHPQFDPNSILFPHEISVFLSNTSARDSTNKSRTQRTCAQQSVPMLPI